MAKYEKRKYSDRRQYLIEAVRKRRKKVRLMAVEYKGGCCQRCGYDRCMDALEFHHIDPSQKDFSISEKGYTRSGERVQRELDKCLMVCANCHRELHVKIAALGSNVEMKSGLSQENPFNEGYPELAVVEEFIVTTGKCRDFTPAALTVSKDLS